MSELKLKIKCLCGRNDLITAEEADKLPWNEDESLTCHCGKKIPFVGHNKPRAKGIGWVS